MMTKKKSPSIRSVEASPSPICRGRSTAFQVVTAMTVSSNSKGADQAGMSSALPRSRMHMLRIGVYTTSPAVRSVLGSSKEESRMLADVHGRPCRKRAQRDYVGGSI
jgi:hypothetical protein